MLTEIKNSLFNLPRLSTKSVFFSGIFGFSFFLGTFLWPALGLAASVLALQHGLGLGTAIGLVLLAAMPVGENTGAWARLAWTGVQGGGAWSGGREGRPALGEMAKLCLHRPRTLPRFREFKGAETGVEHVSKPVAVWWGGADGSVYGTYASR